MSTPIVYVAGNAVGGQRVGLIHFGCTLQGKKYLSPAGPPRQSPDGSSRFSASLVRS